MKKTSKEKALDLYAIAIKREQAKPFKTSSKRKACVSESNSASDKSVHAMNPKTSIFKREPTSKSHSHRSRLMILAKLSLKKNSIRKELHG